MAEQARHHVVRSCQDGSSSWSLALAAPAFPDRFLSDSQQVDAVDSVGTRALHLACMYGSLDCINLLVGENADVTAKDEHGRTPLELAEQSGRPQAVDAIKYALKKVREGHRGW